MEWATTIKVCRCRGEQCCRLPGCTWKLIARCSTKQRRPLNAVARDIDGAKTKLAALPALRAKVDSLAGKPADIIDDYGAIISLLASAIDEIGELTDDARIVRQAIALGAHVRRKEWAGQERATGVTPIATGVGLVGIVPAVRG